MQKYLQKHSDEEIANWGNDLIINKLSLSEISTKYKVPYKTVCNMLLKYGYRKKSKCYPTNVVKELTYFDTIDTAEKAYLLGFLYTDGYICKTVYGEQWGIALQSSDKYILDYLNTATGANKCINCYKNSYKFVCNDKHSCSALKNLGICYNKSHCELHIPNIPEKFINSFILGVFDGDGCITIKSSGYSVVSIVCNSKIFLEEIATKLSENNIITRPINIETKGRQNPLYVMYLSGRENQLKFSDYIYKDSSIYLTRKKDKFMQIPRKTTT